MKSKIVPEDSYGDDFAKQTYAKLVKRLKIDPINEGRLMERRVYNILNPKDITEMKDADAREEARLKADHVAETYIFRIKKFWRVYQLYCFNRGQLRATIILNPWLKNGDEVIDNLKQEQKDILNDEV